MRILLLGGSGLLSAAARDTLLAAGHDVSVLTRGERALPAIARLTLLRAGRGGFHSLAAALHGERYDFTADFLAFGAGDIARLLAVPGFSPRRLVVVSSGQEPLPAARGLPRAPAGRRPGAAAGRGRPAGAFRPRRRCRGGAPGTRHARRLARAPRAQSRAARRVDAPGGPRGGGGARGPRRTLRPGAWRRASRRGARGRLCALLGALVLAAGPRARAHRARPPCPDGRRVPPGRRAGAPGRYPRRFASRLRPARRGAGAGGPARGLIARGAVARSHEARSPAPGCR